MSKNVYVYYSQSGNMTRIIDRIKTIVEGDILQIEAKIPYIGSTKKVIEEWKPEFYNNVIRDAQDYDIDLSKYDTVFVGTPNWGGTMPSPLKSFLMRYSYDGKRIIPIVTHGGGGAATCAEHIYEITKTKDKIHPLVVKKDEVDVDTINMWLNDINF